MRLLPKTVILVVAAAACGQPPRTAHKPGDGYTLHIHVVDVFGKSQPYRVDSFEPTVGPRENLAVKFHDMTIGPVPPGGYTYVLSPNAPFTPYSRQEGRVLLVEFNQWLTIVVHDPVGDREGVRGAYGVVSPVPPVGRANWMRLTELFSGHVIEEAAVESDGTFALTYFRVGRCIVTIFSGEQVFALQPVTFDRHTQWPVRISAERDGGRGAWGPSPRN